MLRIRMILPLILFAIAAGAITALFWLTARGGAVEPQSEIPPDIYTQPVVTMNVSARGGDRAGDVPVPTTSCKARTQSADRCVDPVAVGVPSSILPRAPGSSELPEASRSDVDGLPLKVADATSPQRQGDSTDAAIVAAMGQFRKFSFLYNRPKVLRYGRPNLVILTIASSDLRSAQTRVATGDGESVQKVARFGDLVRASLDGAASDVEIQLVGGARPQVDQAVRDVNREANATWTWYVTPKTLDKVTLTLSIFNEINVAGRAVEQEDPVYSDTFTVQASLLDRWRSTAGALAAGIIAAVSLVASAITAITHYFEWLHKPRPAGGAQASRKRKST